MLLSVSEVKCSCVCFLFLPGFFFSQLLSVERLLVFVFFCLFFFFFFTVLGGGFAVFCLSSRLYPISPQCFLPQDEVHDAKKKKIVNCGVVAFTLARSGHCVKRFPPQKRRQTKTARKKHTK